MPLDQPAVRNLLLSTLPGPLFEELAGHLDLVTLSLRESLTRPGRLIDHLHFPETAVVSVVARSGEEEVEVGLIGRDGAVVPAALLGADRTPFDAFVQMPGLAWRIETGRLTALREANPLLDQHFTRCAEAFTTQVAYTALANGRFPILARLARWILMCHDRVEGDQIDLTHTFLSLMLGVRRAGVTNDMHVLEGSRAVVNRRGRIYVRDRAILERYAGACYGAPEAEYERLFGRAIRRSSAPGPAIPPG